MTNKFCTECGKELISGNRFCINCGNKIEEIYRKEPKENLEKLLPKLEENKEEVIKAEYLPKKEEKVVNKYIKEKKKLEVVTDTVKTIGITTIASSTGGEMVFTQQIPPTNNILSTIGPIRYLLNGIVNIFKNLKEVRRDKKKLIPAIIMTIIWVTVAILPALGITGTPIRYLSFLTFGRGGIGQGLGRVIGGTFGKGLFAYFITSLILPIFSGKKPFKGIREGIKTLCSSFVVREPKGLSPILLGVGISLISYNFITGNGALINSMAGIMGFILALSALSRRAGFLRGFIISIVNKFRKDKHVDNSYVNKIISGITAGFALSIPLSTIGFNYVCYVTGVFLIGTAIILKIFIGKKKGVENA